MNKKLLLIPIGVGLVIFIIAHILEKDETGNKFEMIVVDDSKEVKASKGMKGVILFLDNSGSMKGFVDFASMPNGNEANATFISTLSNFMDRVKSNYQIEPVCYCGGSSYNRRSFLDGMEDFSVFKGAVTQLHKSISELVDSATDSTVVVFASDMILSYGRKVLESKGKSYNKQQLEQLGADVHNAMTNAKGKGLHAILFQYYGDFNGKYYCNYTENIEPNAYSSTLMKDRPYYLLLIGKKDFLKDMADNNIFSNAQHVYATFDLPEPSKKIPYRMEKNAGKVGWNIGNPQNDTIPGTIMSDTDFGDEESSLRLSYKSFNIPSYTNLNSENKLTPKFDNNVIKDVIVETAPESEEQILIVTLNKYKDLSTTKDVTIRLCTDNSWIDKATTLDDVKDGKIEKKTWGFSTVVNNINKVYRSDESLKPEIVAELKFNIIKK